MPSTSGPPGGFDLRRARTNRGLSIRQLAEATGVNRATISNLESGGRAREASLKRLADFFGVEAAALDPAERDPNGAAA